MMENLLFTKNVEKPEAYLCEPLTTYTSAGWLWEWNGEQA